MTGEVQGPVSYRVKNTTPLPKGHFSVVMNETERFLGRSRYFNTAQNIHRSTADICFTSDDSNFDDTSRQNIGKISFIIVNQSRMVNSKDGDASQTFMWACGQVSEDLGLAVNTLFDSEGNVKDVDLDESLSQGDIVYLENVELEPRWRGYGIGLLAVDGLLGLLPSFEGDSVILNPAGISDQAQGQREVPDQKLIKYWSLLGFSIWSDPEDEIMVMGMWTGLVQPYIEDVVPHLFKD